MTNTMLKGKEISVAQALKIVGFPVKLGNIYTASGKKIPNKLVVERTDTKQALGIVSPAYKIIHHEDAIERPLRLLDKEGFKIKSIFFPRQGSHAVIDLLSKESVKIDGDAFKFRLFMRNSYDGHSAFKIEVGLFRLICQNGAGVWAIGGKAKFEAKQIHMGDDKKFAEFYETVAAKALSIKKTVPEYAKLFSSMKDVGVKNIESATKILNEMRLGERVTQNVLNEWQKKENYSPNVYGVYNGLTAYYSRQEEKSKSDTVALTNNGKTRGLLSELIALPSIKKAINLPSFN